MSSPACLRFALPRRPALLLLAALLLAGALPGPARAQAPAPVVRTRVPKEVLPLLSTDLETWMQGLGELRKNPQARELLLQGLEVQPPPERRWRLIHHLAEFGTPDDVPTLVALLATLPEGTERRVLLGTLRALYPAPDPGSDVASIVRDFSYLQSAPPVPLPSDLDQKYVVTELTLQTWWLDRVSPRVIERIISLKGKPYDSQRALAEAIQSRLTPRLWQESGERLLAPLSQQPARLVQDGVLRYRVENSLTRPLLVTVDAVAWFGRLEEAPPRRYLYLKPGESQQIDQPIRVIGPRDLGRVRIDLRAREVNGAGPTPLFKLYAPMQG